MRSAATGTPQACPACGQPLAEASWICPKCDHILDPSVLDSGAAAAELEPRTGTARGSGPKLQSEPTPTASAFEPVFEPPEAMILGDVTIDASDFAVEVIAGSGAQGDGKTGSFLFYASSASA